MESRTKHAEAQTEAGDPAEQLLLFVFRFYHYGYDLDGELGRRRPPADFREFVKDPHMVRHALKVWLASEADLPKMAMAARCLRLWFQDFELPTPEEESHFFSQWNAYLQGLREYD